MRIDVKKEPTIVLTMSISEAQMIVVSLGRNHTQDLSQDDKDAHFALFSQLQDVVGRGGYEYETRERGMYLVKR